LLLGMIVLSLKIKLQLVCNSNLLFLQKLLLLLLMLLLPCESRLLLLELLLDRLLMLLPLLLTSKLVTEPLLLSCCLRGHHSGLSFPPLLRKLFKLCLSFGILLLQPPPVIVNTSLLLRREVVLRLLDVRSLHSRPWTRSRWRRRHRRCSWPRRSRRRRTVDEHDVRCRDGRRRRYLLRCCMKDCCAPLNWRRGRRRGGPILLLHFSDSPHDAPLNR